jgi:hypothetical protein
MQTKMIVPLLMWLPLMLVVVRGLQTVQALMHMLHAPACMQVTPTTVYDVMATTMLLPSVHCCVPLTTLQFEQTAVAVV